MGAKDAQPTTLWWKLFRWGSDVSLTFYPLMNNGVYFCSKKFYTIKLIFSQLIYNSFFVVADTHPILESRSLSEFCFTWRLSLVSSSSLIDSWSINFINLSNSYSNWSFSFEFVFLCLRIFVTIQSSGNSE